MKLFEIKSRFDGHVLFSLECGSLKICLEAAVKADADLARANLAGAYLARANLTDAYLAGAYLANANFDIKPATPEEAVKNLDVVREILMDNPKKLRMDLWHESSDWKDKTCAEETLCGTTHCLAGLLQVCATNPDIRALDSAQLAGTLCAPIAAQMFFAGETEVIDWVRDRKYTAA